MINTKIRLIIFFAAKNGEALYSQQNKKNKQIKRLVADYGSDHELITKVRLKLKNVGKTATSFRYDLNQALYNYTVQMINKFKGLVLIGRVPDKLCKQVCNIV